MKPALSLGARWLWALPCSLLGLLLAVPALLAGARLRRQGHTLEIGLREQQAQVPRLVRRWPFWAITFGHVILGQSHEVLAALRAHERVHVRQYERLGPLFLLAYPAASMWAWCCGQCPYRGNRFEREAFACETRDSAGA